MEERDRSTVNVPAPPRISRLDCGHRKTLGAALECDREIHGLWWDAKHPYLWLTTLYWRIGGLAPVVASWLPSLSLSFLNNNTRAVFDWFASLFINTDWFIKIFAYVGKTDLKWNLLLIPFLEKVNTFFIV